MKLNLLLIVTLSLMGYGVSLGGSELPPYFQTTKQSLTP